MKIENVECHVICDDQNLTEYQEKSEASARGKSCYIISETGKRFIIQVKKLSQSSAHGMDLSVELWIDGRFIRSKSLHKDICDIDSARIDRFTIRPFLFTSIALTDDDRALQEGSSNLDDLGTICIQVYRVSDYRKVAAAPTNKALSSEMQNKPVHEKSKKAGGHRATLGEAQVRERKSTREIIYFDERGSPYYTFTWRYRSKDILQAQGIVPLDSAPLPPKRYRLSTPSGTASKRPRTAQSPSQQGSTSRVKLEDVSSAQERQARVEALRAQLEEEEAALKEELRRANAAGVKREVSPIVLKGVSGDVIDLTEDD